MLRQVFSIAVLGLALALAGCSSNKSTKPLASKAFTSKSMPSKNRFGESLAGFAGNGSPYLKGSGRIPRGGGKYHVGKPYQVAGKWFTPKVQPGYDRKGAASWYGEAFHRRKTSNGEYFDMNMLTAAHPTLPLPSYAKVTNLDSGESIVVRINDRGPFVGTRIIDLSKKSAEALDFKGKGKANVRVQWIGNAPLNDQGKHLAMMNKKVQAGASMGTLIAAVDGPARGNTQVAEATQETGFQQVSFEAPKKKKRVRGEAQTVQVGAFRSLEGAEQAREKLASIGPVQVYEWESANGPLFKVQLGPFTSSVGAEEALNAVRAEGYRKAVLETARIEQVAVQH